MYSESAEFYDLIYSTFKDYPGEAARIAELLRGIHPHCRTILDVASGTGEHARLLAGLGFVVDGLDLDPAFVRLASEKHPAGRFFEGDMSDFRLPHRYDAVLCLFSSIAYLKTLDLVTRTLIRFREHLQSGGVIVVEPWYPPDLLDTTRVARHAGEANGVRVSRVSHVAAEERLSRFIFDYEITDRTGTRHAHEEHELGLFTTAELMAAFRAAGLDATHDPKGLSDRGLFAATVSGAAEVLG